MRHLPNDKYNVAWFKLAEFVARGEKERALGLYRLLIHSFENKALAFQLEGDILLSFNDYDAAVERYMQAAEHYHQEKRFIEASAIHEHIILLQPNNKHSLQKLIDYYEETANIERLTIIIGKFCDLLVNQDEYDDLLQKIECFEELLSIEQLKPIYENMTIILCKKKQPSIEVLEFLIKKVIDLSESPNKITQFLQKIKVLHEDVYLWACDYIKKD